jgi:signal transduction histidine kinase
MALGRNMAVPATDPIDGAESGLFRLIFDSFPEAAVVFDRMLRERARNPAAAERLPRADFVGELLTRISLESNYENWAAELQRIIETGRPRSVDLTAPGGSEGPDVVWHVHIIPLRTASGGEPIGGLLIASDVSHRIGMERRLAVSERLAAVGKLAARVAHELNNPLDGILRFTNLALRRMGEPPEADGIAKLVEYLERIRSGTTRMRDIVSTLLDFSRAAPAGFEQATISKIIEDAVTALEGRAQESNVTVVCNLQQKEMPAVRGSSLFQVFCNLVKNAIDAMPDGGTLTITSRVVGADVVVVFEDTGIGLPADAERIFEPFFTTKPPGKGTGLGLAVCKDLIEKYSGAITARGRQPKGTSFTVTIPTRNCASVLLTNRPPAAIAPPAEH